MRITLFLQMCGRGSRIFEGLDHFNIIDCGGNINRHEFWCSDREWSLLPPKKKKKKQGPAIIKECPNCKALIPAGSKKCKYCGFEYPATSVEQMEIILQRLNPKEQKEWLDAATVEELENYRIAKGFKMGWILYKFTEKNQFFTYQKLRNYKNGWAWYKYKEFVNVCDCCGSEFLGQKHKVYNENNELQDGLISCGACVVEEVISN
jgi:RNA polymerase subunit RPABC4/transcription elongation factor Spt4